MSTPGTGARLSSTDAARRIDDIRDTLGDKALRLAYHAALPVVVDAGLLNLLRVNFFLDPPDDLPYEVEASLLLSPLFSEIGESLYETEPGLRNLLLSDLEQDYGEERVRRVAALLEQYTDSSAAWHSLPELEAAQRLTAMSFLDPLLAEQWLSGAAPGMDTQLDREWYVAMRRRIREQMRRHIREQSAVSSDAVKILWLSGLETAEAEQEAIELLDLRTGPPDLRRLLVLDDTALLVDHMQAYELLDRSMRIGQMLCVAVGPRAGDDLKLRLPGNLGAVQGAPVLWVSNPVGIDWRMTAGTIANRHPSGRASGLDRLVELLLVGEVFQHVHTTLTEEFPGWVASPGLRLASADDEAVTFAAALSMAIHRLCDSGTEADLPFPALLPPQAGGAFMAAGGQLVGYRDRVLESAAAASAALGGLGGILRRGYGETRAHIMEAGRALTDLRDLAAQLLRTADTVGELRARQRWLLAEAGIHFPPELQAGPSAAAGSADQRLVYRTVADALESGDSLPLVARRLALTERELKRYGSASYLPEVEQSCPPTLLDRLTSPPQRLPRRSNAEVRRELGLDDAARAAQALADLVIAVANREWSTATPTSDEASRTRIAIDGVRTAMTEQAAAAVSADSGPRGARLSRLAEYLAPMLCDLALRVLAAEFTGPSASGIETFEAAQGRTTRLLLDWASHVQRKGISFPPPFASATAQGTHLYAHEVDDTEIRETLLYPPSEEMWQLCLPDDLHSLDLSAQPHAVRFAPRLIKDALAGTVPSDTIWTSSGGYAGLLRLVALQPNFISSNWEWE